MASLSPARRSLRPRGSLSCPPRPSSCRPKSPGGGAASGRPPSHASRRAAGPHLGPWPGPRAPGVVSGARGRGGGGADRRLCRPRRKRRDGGSTSAGQLGTSRREALRPGENLQRGSRLGAAPARRRPLESAPRKTCPPRGGDHAEPAGRGAPGAGGALASRPRQSPSRQLPAR